MNLSLRQRKLFKTKLALAKLFVEKLKTVKLDDISIKDICAEAEVCEATFFNYFPQKIDVIAYLLKAKLFKIYRTINNLQKSLPFTECIEKTFELFAKEIKHPYTFFEVVSLFRPRKEQIDSCLISPEELQYIYPDCSDVETTSLPTLYEFFEEKVSNAKEKKQIPQNICKKTLTQFLLTILKGAPLSTPISEFSKIAQIYQNHLSFLWKILQP